MKVKSEKREIINGAVWHEDFKCFVHFVRYEFRFLTGFVYMLDGSCTDMAGSIRFFEKIDPQVQQIITCYQEREEPDTCYRKVSGEWIAFNSKIDRPLRDPETTHQWWG